MSDNPEIAPPPDLPKFMRPVGADIKVSARYGSKGPWWDWHYDAQAKLWKQGVICTDCGELFRMFDTKTLCKCGHRNGLGQHKGIDFASPEGTMVFAVADGMVEAAGWENAQDEKQGFGQRIRQTVTAGTQMWKVFYGHLSQIQVKSGQHIKQGDVIALTGNTGRTSGAHLHVEVRDGRNQQVAFEFIKEATV